jgi:radical SAM protein with 4Fe4S-binding SPASM domain
MPSIDTVFLHITKACNLHCSYCYFSASKPLPNEMTTEDFARVWPQLVTLRPLKAVFTGGEPLLRPDLLDLLRGFRGADPEHQIRLCLNSNGHLVTKEFAAQLVDVVDEVRVSVDGLRGRNDAQRGVGNFDAAMNAMECYAAVGLEPKVLVTVTAASLPDLEDLLCFLIANNITRIKLNEFRPIGRAQGRLEWVVSVDEMRACLHRAWRRMYPGLKTAPDSFEADCQSHCGVGKFLNIMPDGDVFPCHVLTSSEFRCGNVKEQRLLDICQADGLMSVLSNLDFRELSCKDSRLNGLTKTGSCMGNVYAQTKSLSIWRDHLPLVQITEALSTHTA